MEIFLKPTRSESSDSLPMGKIFCKNTKNSRDYGNKWGIK